MMVGRLVSFWEGLFSGSMLNFGRVNSRGPGPLGPTKKSPSNFGTSPIVAILRGMALTGRFVTLPSTPWAGATVGVASMMSMMLCCLMMCIVMMSPVGFMHMYPGPMLRHMLSMSMMSTMSFVMSMLVHGPCCQAHLHAYQHEQRDTAHCDEGEITENAPKVEVFCPWAANAILDKYQIFQWSFIQMSQEKKNCPPFSTSFGTVFLAKKKKKRCRPFLMENP